MATSKSLAIISFSQTEIDGVGQGNSNPKQNGGAERRHFAWDFTAKLIPK